MEGNARTPFLVLRTFLRDQSGVFESGSGLAYNFLRGVYSTGFRHSLPYVCNLLMLLIG